MGDDPAETLDLAAVMRASVAVGTITTGSARGRDRIRSGPNLRPEVVWTLVGLARAEKANGSTIPSPRPVQAAQSERPCRS
jgi:hypothetical protein